MSRLINADELIEEIKSHRMVITGLRYGKSALNEYVKCFTESILKIIDEQPTVEVPETGKWIPWDRKNLPPEGELVEVTIKPKILKTPLRDIGYYDRDREEWWKYDEDGLLDVIAWKIPSEPYHPNKCHGCFGAANNDCERCVDGNEK